MTETIRPLGEKEIKGFFLQGSTMTCLPALKGNSSIGAGVAGASGGTGLLLFLNSIPDTNYWKPLLVFAAPTISIAISGLWIFIRRLAKNWSDERDLDVQLKKACDSLRLIEEDPFSSDQTKKKARLQVEEIRMLKLKLLSRRVRAIIKS